MTNDIENPYASPAEIIEASAAVVTDSTGTILAGRMTRLGAAILDGILMVAVLLPIQFATGYIQRAQSQQSGLIEQFAMSVLGLAVMLALNGYLLATRGQTIGKIAAGIQIVDFETGRLLPFVRVFVYRYLWSLPLAAAEIIIPGAVDNLLLNFVTLIDTLMIFGESRRCLHDLIAGSKVVIYEPNRQKLD